LRLTPLSAASSSASVKFSPAICSAPFNASLPTRGGVAPPPRCAAAGVETTAGNATPAATVAGTALRNRRRPMR
jgi:hypothetical protein